MAIYEYLCEKCGQFEVNQKITDKSLKRCPTCDGKVKKLISLSSFQLKGSGWYLTDYSRKDRGRKEKAEEKKPSAEAKGDGKVATGQEKSSTKPVSSESTAP